mmetsp:Transcript_40995/g.123702  ORF Transcript_40995/g.123702 Transcript_40995/m.123702 type:complete len:437 (-) Transcript_40995:10376-11686(-)
MARVSLGVEHEELGQVVVPERLPEGGDLVPRAGRGGGGVGARLVGEVYAVRRDLRLAYAVEELHVREEALQFGRNVGAVEGGAVVGRVGILGGEEAGPHLEGMGRRGRGRRRRRRRPPGAHQSSLAALLGLQNHPDGPGPQEHPGPSPVERARRLRDDGGGGGRAEGAESGAEPGEERRAGRVVPRHHHHALGAAGDEHVLCHGDGLSGSRARRVGLGVRSPYPRQLRQLRVPQHQNPKEKLPVELVVLLTRLARVALVPLDLPRPRQQPRKGRLVVVAQCSVVRCPQYPPPQRSHQPHRVRRPHRLGLKESHHLPHGRVHRGKARGVHHPRRVPVLLWQPPLLQLRCFPGNQPRRLERLHPRRHGHLRRHVHRLGQSGRDPVQRRQVDRPQLRRELNHVRFVLHPHLLPRPVGHLLQLHHPLIEQRGLGRARHGR